MEKPSFKSSPWIRGAPHRVFSRDIRRIRSRISLDTGGRPDFPRRDFHVQKSLNPLRCQPMTVSGLTITRVWRQPGHRPDRMTQKTLSAIRSDGRGLFRFRTATCCRRAKISVWSAARPAKISTILYMPERVSRLPTAILTRLQSNRAGLRKAQGLAQKGRRTIRGRTLEKDRRMPQPILPRRMRKLLPERWICFYLIGICSNCSLRPRRPRPDR